MVVGDDVIESDVVVIGGGPGGYTAALSAAGPGRRVTLVERHHGLGGVCLNVGCIPSKALIHVADIAALRDDAAVFGLGVDVSVDMARVRAWIDGIVAGHSDGIARRLATADVDVIHGTARFVGPRRCAVDDGSRTQFIEFGQAVVATGSRPMSIPSLTGDPRVLDSTGALALSSVPERLVVIGGGFIGLELGTVFAKLGSRVTIVEALPTLLTTFNQSLVRVVSKRLVELGVEVRLSTRVEGPTEKGVLVTCDGIQADLPADAIIVAVGRQPNTDELDLQLAGVKVEASGHIVVDDQLRASPTVFALGDVTPGPPLAHRASAQAETVGAILKGQRRAFQPACIPNVVYTDPELVSVGLTVAEAQADGLRATALTLPMSASGRASTLGRRDGRVELVVQQDGTIIGVHMVGVGVSELSGEAALAIEMQATVEDLALTIHAHPSLSEMLRDAAALHTTAPLIATASVQD